MPRVIEIEPDTPTNDNVQFLPQQTTLRGRFRLGRVREPMANSKLEVWGEEIPGQILGIDLDSGEGYIREPLFDHEYHDVRRKIEAQKFKLGEKEQRFAGVDVATWLYWMKRLVQDKLCKLVKGAFPDKIEGSPKTRYFFTHEPAKREEISRQEAKIASLEALIEKQAAMLAQQAEQTNKLIALLAGKVEPGNKSK